MYTLGGGEHSACIEVASMFLEFSNKQEKPGLCKAFKVALQALKLRFHCFDASTAIPVAKWVTISISQYASEASMGSFPDMLSVADLALFDSIRQDCSESG